MQAPQAAPTEQPPQAAPPGSPQCDVVGGPEVDIPLLMDAETFHSPEGQAAIARASSELLQRPTPSPPMHVIPEEPLPELMDAEAPDPCVWGGSRRHFALQLQCRLPRMSHAHARRDGGCGAGRGAPRHNCRRRRRSASGGGGGGSDGLARGVGYVWWSARVTGPKSGGGVGGVADPLDGSADPLSGSAGPLVGSSDILGGSADSGVQQPSGLPGEQSQ